MRARRQLLALVLAGPAVMVCSAQEDTQPVHQAPAARQLVDEPAAGRHPGITGFQLVVNDAEPAAFASVAIDRAPADIRSVTKSIAALLVGIAIDRGLLPSVDAKAIAYLPEIHDLLADGRVGHAGTVGVTSTALVRVCSTIRGFGRP